MDRNESANEGGSSPDTVIARSSSEEERNRFACSTSGEYVTVGDSSSSVDTVTSVGTTTNVATGDPPAADDKKKGRFGALKSSFRKEGGLFKIRRKNRQLDESAAEPELDVEEKDSQSSEKSPRLEVRCSSALPYALSKWAEQKPPKPTSTEPPRKSKLNTKSESESGIPKSSPREVRRKLSLLEEKRAIFQRRLFETTRDTDSGETVIAVTVDDDDKSPSVTEEEKREENQTKKKARHISVKKFDTFSTFEGTFDEETGVGYLAGIEEDYTESYDRQHDSYLATVGSMMADNAEKSKVVSQDSMSSQNNAPNAGLGDKREHLYKILVIGELGAGKTSIIKRYVHQFFSQHYRATIGVDFALKVLNWDPHTIIRLQLWDIAGQERFGNMTRVYYKEAVGAFIVFDVTRSATLDAVVKWKQDLDSKVQLPDGSQIPCVLLANKCDQQKEGLVNSPAKMDEYCKEKNFAGWFETSAKENINIEEAARFLVNKILQNDQMMKGNGSQDQTDGERFALNQTPTSSKKSCSC
ncbi:RAS oncogene family member Rab32 isoform X2 [Bombus vancouverensis nearcticus]|uniref:RAS oncogene family member Rab32 isoform X2 n=1 Tax=Bombus vancouverensis nearcticus TaxID=2705178 RepID=UPI00402B9D6C